uniref:Uncharacterized protein n=1 Tax=Malurus cyaneus samueli TaxID=2593467 RepID=A0A8C5TQL5_9PASS
MSPHFISDKFVNTGCAQGECMPQTVRTASLSLLRSDLVEFSISVAHSVIPWPAARGAHAGDVVLTFLSFWYLLQTSLVRPAAALAGLSGGTMLWFTSAERCVRTVERWRQCASPGDTATQPSSAQCPALGEP